MEVFPLIFEPIFKPKIWGGRCLETLLGKRLPAEEPIGESWELTDLEEDQSVVARGPAKGKTLGELVQSWGKELLGGASLFEGRFPLLIKYLDAREMLSVQVHPDEAAARRLGGRVRIKNEAWYIIDAAEDGFIYRGVHEGVDAAVLRRAIEEQRVESVLKRIPVRKGHCYYLPSGTIHALGGGVVVAEVQTPSDVTYRVYDWNRVDPSTGEPRTLHLEDALASMHYDTTPLAAEKLEHLAGMWTTVTSLVRCESFVIERVRMAEGVDLEMRQQEMVIWMVLEGRGTIAYEGPTVGPASSRSLDRLEAGPTVAFEASDTVLIPAGLRGARLQTQEECLWLEVSIPVPSSLAGFQRPEREASRNLGGGAAGWVQLSAGDHPAKL